MGNSKEYIKGAYTKLSVIYGDSYKANGYSSYRTYSIRKNIVQFMLNRISDDVLFFMDSGCGNGFFFENVVKPTLKSLQTAHGIDFVSNNTSQAEHVFEKTFTGDVLDIAQLTDATYDLVMSNEVFQYIPPQNWGSFFSNHASILKDRGYFLLTVSNLSSIYRLIFRPQKDLFPFDFNAYDILTLARKSSFEVVAFCGIDPLYNIYLSAPLVVKRLLSFEYSFLLQKK
jgi:predicted TPR repeat methyltransferase